MLRAVFCCLLRGAGDECPPEGRPKNRVGAIRTNTALPSGGEATALGGFRVQGRSAAQAKQIIDDARILEEAGAFSILLEMVPTQVCARITERSSIPIISLGSGPDADGQLLIYHDMFGLYPKFTPKMARVYADAGQAILGGLKQYVEDVTTKDFPQRENWFRMRNSAYEELTQELD